MIALLATASVAEKPTLHIIAALQGIE